MAWGKDKPLADWLSNGLVAGQLVTDLWDASQQHHLGCEIARIGVTHLVADATKHAAKRMRPDGSDNLSFYSEHTAMAVVSSGWRYQVSIPIAIGTGYLRMAANKHHATDVLVGAGVGALTRKLCR